jgi:hypothetical protein
MRHAAIRPGRRTPIGSMPAAANGFHAMPAALQALQYLCAAGVRGTASLEAHRAGAGVDPSSGTGGSARIGDVALALHLRHGAGGFDPRPWGAWLLRGVNRAAL